ncbi:OmpA family protein [Caldisalinibacter kiritimatiensis]|uniref:Outer membrane protein A n=1 Tax=Caldisalinibacter kiritimatiensis TaxID=1304284 RepID=R1CTC5_9FIRM|nr:OmpA family protein [Caldisalinibacter kiritimatiensis]EOD01896.1 Outer membrane protein A precursor [Caldisalinibacter kiritimatiensis]
MKVRRRSYKKDGEVQNFWPSFTDMISTIALILFFLMLLAYIQNIVTGSNLEYAKKQLMDTQKRLEESNAEISRAEKRLRLLKDNLDEVKAEVERGQIALKLSEEQIEEQKEIIAESNKELGKLRSTLQGIALFRVNVLEKVKNSVEEELGKTNSDGEQLVSIADNGNIVINESLVFDYNSYKIKSEGKELLDQLAVAFENVLEDEDIRKNIDAINIQGHADKMGDPEYNRELSAKRATTVVNYLMKTNNTLEEKYGRYFMASGFSNLRPITSGNTEEERAKNRRIEISLILKDSNVRDVINKYLEDSKEIFGE